MFDVTLDAAVAFDHGTPSCYVKTRFLSSLDKEYRDTAGLLCVAIVQTQYQCVAIVQRSPIPCISKLLHIFFTITKFFLFTIIMIYK